MSTVSVNWARREDVPAILALANWAADHTVANLATAHEPLSEWQASFDGTSQKYPWIVARDTSERVVGFAKGAPYKARGAYAWTAEVTVYIDVSVHGKGVGTRLYDVLVPTLRAQGYVTLVAGITVPNTPSERLHERFGFVRCATYHRVGFKEGKWHDVGFWELMVRTGDDAPGAIADTRSVGVGLRQ